MLCQVLGQVSGGEIARYQPSQVYEAGGSCLTQQLHEASLSPTTPANLPTSPTPPPRDDHIRSVGMSLHPLLPPSPASFSRSLHTVLPPVSGIRNNLPFHPGYKSR